MLTPLERRPLASRPTSKPTTRSLVSIFGKFLSVLAACMAWDTKPLRAQANLWTGAVDSDWYEAANWSIGVPSGSSANISANGPVVLSGGTASWLILRLSGNQTMTISDAAQVSGVALVVGDGSPAEVVLTGTDTVVSLVSPRSPLGIYNSCVLTVSDGARLSAVSTDASFVPVFFGGGVLNLGSGGTLETVRMGRSSSSSAKINFDGGIFRSLGDTTNLFQNFQAGEVELLAEGGTFDTNGFDVTASNEISGIGALTKTGAGTLTLTGNNTYAGGTTLSDGTLVVGNNNALGTGTLGIGNGVTLAADGARRITNDIVFDGDLRIFPGGTLVSFSAFELDGNLDLNGGNRTLTNTMNFNAFEFGQVNIGGVISNGGLTFADDGFPVGNVVFFRLDGSAANTYSGDTVVGSNVSLALAKEANVTAIAGDILVRSEAVVASLNSEQIADTSTLTFEGAGRFQVGNGTGVTETVAYLHDDDSGLAAIDLEDQNGGSTLRVGEGLFSGSINGGTVGSTSLEKFGLGSLVLTGDSTFTGATSVSGGTLLVNGSLGNTAVSVETGATLGGTGTIAGAVTVQSGGFLSAGNSPGTLTMGQLILNTGSRTVFELGAPGSPGMTSDLINVTGNLTLQNGALLDLIPIADFQTGTYRLFDYGGTLSGNVGSVFFGTAPAGHNLTLDAATSGQVNLLVNYDGLQFWNGAQTTPDGTVHGGAGTWDSATTNWTNENGNVSNAWESLTAVFSGSAGGAVTIDEDLTIAGLQFATDGYTLEGTGSLELGEAQTEIRIDSGLSATIETTLTGGNALVKTGDGTILLSGDNTYSGGTRLLAGMVRVDGISALGAGLVTIAGGHLGTSGVDGSAFVDNALQANTDFSIDVQGSNGMLDFGGDFDLGSAPLRTLTFTGEGEACFGGIISGNALTLTTAHPNGSIVMFCGDQSNAFAGLLTVGDGISLLLSKDPGTLAVSGNLLVESGGIVGLLGDDQFATASDLELHGTLDGFLSTTTTVNALSGTGTISGGFLGSTLVVNLGNFSGKINDGSGPQALVKQGNDTLRLTGASDFTGGTTINGGILETQHVTALGAGPVTINDGSLAPVGTLTIDSLTWEGGTILASLGSTTSFLEIIDTLSLGLEGGTFNFTEGTDFEINTGYTILSAANLDESFLSLFSGNTLLGIAPAFSMDGINLMVTFAGNSSGSTIQNAPPVGTPANADFLVVGAAETGTIGQSNTVNSLIFSPGSTLRIYNNLTVTSGNFTVDQEGSSITGGNLIVPGAFRKLGAGLLNLLNQIIINGPAEVLAGALLVNGDFTTSDGLTIFQNALLGGAGTINGNIFNYGTLAPGNSPGTLTINGNLTLFSGSTTQIEIASLDAFDQIFVTGLATLGGTLQVTPYGGYSLAYGQQFQFLNAGSVTGAFDSIELPPNFRGRILVDGGTVTLLVAPSSYTLVAQNTNQANVAAALDSFIPATSGDRLEVSTALDMLSAAEYPSAFDQIAPAFHSTVANITLEQAFTRTQLLNQRLSSARLGIRGFQSFGIEPEPLVYDKGGRRISDPSKEVFKSRAPDLNWSTWAQGNGTFARVTHVSQVPNLRFNSGGFLAGADYDWFGNNARRSSLITGLYAGYQGTDAEYEQGGSTRIHSTLFGGYASFAHGGFYADGVLAGGYHNYSVRRPINFSTIGRTAKSTQDGGELSAALNLGYDWQIGPFTFGPILGAQYTYLGIAPFNESGAQSLNLRVDSQSINSLRSTLGGRIAFTWKLTDSIRIIPEARLLWQHEFLNNPRSLGASLNGGAGPGFDYTTSAPGRDSVFAGTGVTAQIGERWNTYFYYNADFGRQDYIGHTISAGLGLSF